MSKKRRPVKGRSLIGVAEGGSLLGLAIAKRIIELHGGRL
jgi:signal transduction histidine kinase